MIFTIVVQQEHKKRERYNNSRVYKWGFKNGPLYKILHSNANLTKSLSSELNIDIVYLLFWNRLYI